QSVTALQGPAGVYRGTLQVAPPRALSVGGTGDPMPARPFSPAARGGAAAGEPLLPCGRTKPPVLRSRPSSPRSTSSYARFLTMRGRLVLVLRKPLRTVCSCNSLKESGLPFASRTLVDAEDF